MSDHHTRLGNDQGKLRRKVLLGRAGRCCERCGVRLTMARHPRGRGRLGEPCELHHIVPLAKAGAHTLENVELLCKPCHAFRHSELRDKEMPADRRAWQNFQRTPQRRNGK